MNVSLPVPAGIVATYRGIRVPGGPHLGRGITAAMAAGTFERLEVDLALAHVPKGARILELGTGSGLAGAVVALNRAPDAMLSVEANPRLLPHIAALYAENGLQDRIALRHGVVLSAPDAPKAMTFYVRRKFPGSSLTQPAHGEGEAVQVPVLPYAALKADFPHDVLLMDIEGAELDFLRHADLSGLRLLIAEFHRYVFGREGLRDCARILTAKGFVRDADASSGEVQLWRAAP